MEYKIVEFNEATGQIVIQVEGFPLFSVDLPLDENNNVPVGVELEQYIKGFIPVWHIERQNKLAIGIANAAEIRVLVQAIPVEQAISTIQSETDNGLKAAILSVLQEEGIIK